MTPDQRKAETERLKRICEENAKIAKLRSAQRTVPDAQPAVDPLPVKNLTDVEALPRHAKQRLVGKMGAANDDTPVPTKRLRDLP